MSQDGLVDLLRQAANRNEERAEHQHLREQIRGQYSFANVIGQSRVMKELFELIDRVAVSDANILIQGENGTGKELIANAIHHNSNRASRPFIKINCAAIPKDLIESELFGYKKGAFTGAGNDKVGLLELAEGGSLLLDEIGEMPAYLQTKLLRVLQEREYRPVGSDRLVTVDFRLICATNIDLEVALRDGRLREDLYFRINTISMRVPPLRERTEDIPLLCNHFLSKFNQRYQKSVRSVSPAAYHLLIRNRWPGNVRELENAIERAVLVRKTGEILPGDLPESIREETPPAQDFTIPPHRTLAEIEKMAIVQTLQRTNWNKQEAAQILGLYRPTLYSKMKKHDIKDQRTPRRAGAPRAAAGSVPDAACAASASCAGRAPSSGCRVWPPGAVSSSSSTATTSRTPPPSPTTRCCRSFRFCCSSSRCSARSRQTRPIASSVLSFVFRYFPTQLDFVTGQLDAFACGAPAARRRGIARARSGARSACSVRSRAR